MTFDELLNLYKAEMNGSLITPVRQDLRLAMMGLRMRLRRECEKQEAIDPDSVMCEGAEHRKKSAERLCKEVARIRTTKICNMAFLDALGSKSNLDVLTDEESEYYRDVLALTERHLGSFNRAEVKEKPSEEPETALPPYRVIDTGVPFHVRSKAFAVLADGGWHTMTDIIEKGGIAKVDGRSAMTLLRDSMAPAVNDGAVERYPPMVKGRHFRGELQYRLAKKEGGA